MKITYVLMGILYALLILMGCFLFKDTSKNSVKDLQKSHKLAEWNRLNVKTANKETNVFSYWSDSGFYQYQNIKENIDQVKSASSKTKEKKAARAEQVIKKSVPSKIWIYVGLLGVLVGCYFVYKRFEI